MNSNDQTLCKDCDHSGKRVGVRYRECKVSKFGYLTATEREGEIPPYCGTEAKHFKPKRSFWSKLFRKEN